MDHYNEQLVQKQTEISDIVKRVLIILATVILSAVCAFGAFVFGFMPLIVVIFGIFYLSWYLISATMVEYEYIITNNDMDIDKITGRRKRKRLITVKLNTVMEWGEYREGMGGGADATVMASDASGESLWYVLAKHEKFGKVMVLFNPTEETAININYGVPFSIRKKDLAVKESDEEEETEQQ